MKEKDKEDISEAIGIICGVLPFIITWLLYFFNVI